MFTELPKSLLLLFAKVRVVVNSRYAFRGMRLEKLEFVTEHYGAYSKN